MKTKAVLGIGTGRCGSMSLKMLLSQCLDPRGRISHEDPLFRRHPWALAANANSGNYSVYGDVAAYWLPKLSDVIEQLNAKPKIILMVRHLEEFIQSLEKRWEYNKFTKRPRTGWLKFVPYIPGNSIRECATKYWKDYNAKALTYEPFVMQTNDLNNDEELTKLYDYLEFDTRVYPFKRRYNES
jgi:hypothetical protein